MLLAAGRGSRLKPYTDVWPKCLMPVRGRPLLEYWINDLVNIGCRDILINTNYLSDIVHEFLQKKNIGVEVKIHKEEALLGTAGTIRAVADRLGNGTTLIAHADNWTNLNLSKFYEFHLSTVSQGFPISMAVFQSHNPSSCGVVELDDRSVVTGFFEKSLNPPSNIASTAILLVEPVVIEWIKSRPSVSDISLDVIPRFIGKIRCYQHDGIHRDIGTIDELKWAQLDNRDPVDLASNKWINSFSASEIVRRISSLNET